MNYVKGFFFHFLIVFFADYVLPGVEVVHITKLFHIQADLLFPLVLGFLNSFIYPILRVFDRNVSWLRMGSFSLILNFIAYAFLKLVSIGIEIVTLEGYLLASLSVSIGSFILNYFEMKHYLPPKNEEGVSQ